MQFTTSAFNGCTVIRIDYLSKETRSFSAKKIYSAVLINYRCGVALKGRFCNTRN